MIAWQRVFKLLKGLGRYIQWHVEIDHADTWSLRQCSFVWNKYRGCFGERERDRTAGIVPLRTGRAPAISLSSYPDRGGRCLKGPCRQFAECVLTRPRAYVLTQQEYLQRFVAIHRLHRQLRCSPRSPREFSPSAIGIVFEPLRENPHDDVLQRYFIPPRNTRGEKKEVTRKWQ